MRLLHRLLLIALMLGLTAFPFQPSGAAHKEHRMQEAQALRAVVVARHTTDAHCTDHHEHANCLIGCCGSAWIAIPGEIQVAIAASMYRVSLMPRPGQMPREWSFGPAAPPPKRA